MTEGLLVSLFHFENRKEMQKKSKLRLLVDIIWDKSLYGRGFFRKSFLYLVFGLVVQFFMHFLFSPHLLIIYLPAYVSVILITAGFTKNIKREIHPMPPWLAYLLLFTSALSKAFAFVAPFPDVYFFFPPFLQRLSVLMISETALFASLVTIVILGQRSSIRDSVGLDDRFFDKEKDRWKDEVEDFPNLDKILEGLDGGRFIADLFDKGFFNLTILWSCNIMEEVIDAITDGIIGENPENKSKFRNKEGRRKPYPVQLENLGYISIIKQPKDEEFDVEKLWHEVRNKIAHHNYTPTFDETKETLKTLISLVKATPKILLSKSWLK